MNNTYFLFKQISKLRNTNARGVPGPALIVSALLLGAWLPALHYAKETLSLSDVRYTGLHCSLSNITHIVSQFEEILTAIGTECGVFVWGVQCLAFIRYRQALYKWRDELEKETDLKKYNMWIRKNPDVAFRTSLTSHGLQPFAAWFGLLRCFLITFVLNTASWWQRQVTPVKDLSTYTGVSRSFCDPSILL